MLSSLTILKCYNKKKCFLSTSLLISEGSCDTEDWNNGSWKFSFAITERNYI